MTAVLMFFCLFAPLAFSHPLDMALVQANFEGKTIKASLDLNPAIVAIIMKIPSQEMSPAALSNRAESLLSSSLASGELEYGGGKCSWSGAGIEFPNPNTVRVLGVANCPAEGDAFTWRFPFLRTAGIPSSFHVLMKATADGQERTQSSDPGNDKIAFTLEKRPQGWFEKIKRKLGL